MTQTPISYSDSLRIGTIDFISPDEVKVLLEIDAPESVALNAGGVRPFPRVNGYVLMPVDDGFLVGQIEWLTIERSQFPKRRGVQDFGLVDLPYPLRKMSVNPLGTLRRKSGTQDEYKFRRGADALPSLGSPVLLPTERQLKSIVKSGENRRVKIGTSPLAGNAEVCVDPDRLFGRHLAVLGNTGSGKSCSVAGLIRWSLEAANAKRRGGGSSNARFLILDPNGEYSRAFADKNGALTARVFKVDASEANRVLNVPLWLWNSEEWCSFADASGKTQRPVLKRALREVRAGKTGLPVGSAEERENSLRRFLSAMQVQIAAARAQGLEKTEESKFGFRLKAYAEDLIVLKGEHANHEQDIAAIEVGINAAIAATMKEYPPGNHYFRAFTHSHLDSILQPTTALVEKLGGLIYLVGPEEDCPIPFKGVALADQIDLVAKQQNVTQFVEFLTMRVRTMLGDTRMTSIISPEVEMSLAQWLSDYLGKDGASNGPVSIIDLSLVPSEITHILAAVIARMTFETLQRYRKLHSTHSVFPTVLVMEEAHSFIKRHNDGSDAHDASTVCCQVFERIAREGRKFGLGLVLSSQRPSELSPTVLSQCNTFLLHRISNDRDQDLVHRLVPDNLRGLLRELPSLPSQHAILMGWASELPILVRMNDLPKDHQPHSDDPDFWNVWTGWDAKKDKEVLRPVDWQKIADDWQGRETPGTSAVMDDDDDKEERNAPENGEEGSVLW